MVWIMVIISGLAGFGFGFLARQASRKRLVSPVEELIDQTEWLPISRIFMHERDGHTFYYATRIMELEGGFRLTSSEDLPNQAKMHHNGVFVSMTDKQKCRLGVIFNDRLTRNALDSANTKLLEP